MKQWKSERGVTLIEVLATLTVMSLFGGIVYGVFINGINYSSKAKDTVSIQQEANYVLTILKEMQEKKDSYTVSVKDDPGTGTGGGTVTIINKVKGQSETISIENPLFSYKLCDLDDPTHRTACDKPYEDSDFNKVISNTSKESFYVKIVIINKKNSNLTYEVQTILSRL